MGEYGPEEFLFKRTQPEAQIPIATSPGCIGFDIFPLRNCVVRPWETKQIDIGIAFRPPEGHYLRIAPKGGVAKRSCHVMGGVSDRDYTGEIAVFLFNANPYPVLVVKSKPIAQVVAEAAQRGTLREVSELPSTTRGGRRFGEMTKLALRDKTNTSQ